MRKSASIAGSETAERALIRRACAGSLPAFDELMRLFEPRVFAFLLRRCSSRQDAEDLVQETFLRAWQRLHLYNDRWAFSTWILTIAARLSATHHRRRRDERPGSVTPEPAAGDARPDDAVGAHESRQSLWSLADRVLSEEQRLALWLRYSDDMPIKDIGRVLGKSAVATRVLLFRARAVLASHMSEDEQAQAAQSTPRGAPRAEAQVIHANNARRAGLALADVPGGP